MEQPETPKYFKAVNNSTEVAKVTVENDSIYLERTWRNRPFPFKNPQHDFFRTNIGVKFRVERSNPDGLGPYLADLVYVHGWIECTYEEFLRGLLQ